MRIAINLIPFSSWQGTEVFAKNIIIELLQITKDIVFFILASETLPDLLTFPNIKILVIKGLKYKYSKALYQQTFIYFLLKKNKIDLLFSPSPAAPFFYKNKIVIIHDCAYDRFKEFDNLLSEIYLKLMYYGAKYFSKKIITSSNFSKKELINLYKIEENKIEVIHGAVPFLPEVNKEFIENTLNKFKITRPYFIYVGNWRPRKNLPGLIQAFKLFIEKNRNFKLVIAGKKDKRFLDLEKIIKEMNLLNNVIITGFITEEEKVALYKGSNALTFPSFYEGFGLPILEAQSLGVPVLTSNTSSLPEIAGDGALFVNPFDIEEISKGMEKIVFDENLRKDLIQKGYENIKRFSWRKSAEELLEIFKEVKSS